ncbi:MAG: HAD family hydrolase [Lachnospiraceae bacterium]|nr:HAD family hydrolase [Lachnospiraceae bacterium]
MEQEIIFFDIDGTLFSPVLGKITPRVKKSIEKVRSQGKLCFIASGRPYPFIADNVKEIGFDGYVLANGGEIRQDGRILKSECLDYDEVKAFCHKLKEKGIEYALMTSEAAYLPESSRTMLDYYSKCNIDYKNFIFDYEEDDIFHKILKIELWADSEDELEYVMKHCGTLAHELHADGKSMEFNSFQHSKATGIHDVLKMLHIPVENSYCFGDGPNDVEMFETVGHPFAMGNALDIIKEKAEAVCPDVLDDGVAVKLQELFDI